MYCPLQGENQSLKGITAMAKVILIGLEQATAAQIGNALESEKHDIVQMSDSTPPAELLHADIIFAGNKLIHLLREIRNDRPTLPFVVVARIPETAEWLDALEAGATDYCSAPFEPRQFRWLMENALPLRQASQTTMAAA